MNCTNPLGDASPWTIEALCMCQGCRNRRDERSRALLRRCLYEYGPEPITYRRWMPSDEIPTPNLPARRKWLLRRHRTTLFGKTTYLLGWVMTSPSGATRWYMTREIAAHQAMWFRHDEMLSTMNDLVMELI